MRVTYGQYLTATALTLARRHRPVWNHLLRRITCRCGKELPCRVRHRIPISRVHWPELDR